MDDFLLPEPVLPWTSIASTRDVMSFTPTLVGDVAKRCRLEVLHTEDDLRAFIPVSERLRDRFRDDVVSPILRPQDIAPGCTVITARTRSPTRKLLGFFKIFRRANPVYPGEDAPCPFYNLNLDLVFTVPRVRGLGIGRCLTAGVVSVVRQDLAYLNSILPPGQDYWAVVEADLRSQGGERLTGAVLADIQAAHRAYLKNPKATKNPRISVVHNLMEWDD